MNNQRNWIIITCIIFGLVAINSQASYASVPKWFHDKLKACKASIPGPLEYTEKYCKKIDEMSCAEFGYRTLKIPDSVNAYDVMSVSNPGTGKCCVFDKDGNILKSQFVTNGNDGCDKLLKDTPNAKHYGIWWFVQGWHTTKLDWWHGSR